MLLRRAQKGDSAAFEALVTPAEPMLWRLCWHYTHSEQDAADCLQETMIRAWRALPSFRGDASLSSWLYRICVNICNDHARRAKRTAAVSLDVMRESGFDPADPGDDAAEALLKKEKREQILQAMNSLPDPMREVLVLGAIEGKSYEEIAELTGAPIGSVKSRFNRAREKMCRLIGNMNAAPSSEAVKGGH